jgi:hypothetical protein
MYCSSCGTEVTKELNYCNRCGANLNPTPNVSEQPTRVVSMNGPIWAIALMAVIGLGIVFSGVSHLADKNIHPAVLIWMALGGLGMIVGVAALFLRQLSHMNTALKSVEKPAPRKKANIKEARPAQLPPSRIEPVPSVTENTTRTFEPIYREPVERGK